jgi:hypothetical protein
MSDFDPSTKPTTEQPTATPDRSDVYRTGTSAAVAAQNPNRFNDAYKIETINYTPPTPTGFKLTGRHFASILAAVCSIGYVWFVTSHATENVSLYAESAVQAQQVYGEAAMHLLATGIVSGVVLFLINTVGKG